MSPRCSVPDPRRGLLAFAALTAAALTLAACGSSYGGSSSTGQAASGQGSYGTTASAAGDVTTRTAAASGVAGTTLTAHRGTLGTFIVDAKGRPVYLFEQDTSTSSTCEGACAAAWPPVTASTTPKAGAGLQQRLVATSPRADGSTQITYAGHPLYRYAGDQQPGEPTGQGAKAFGAAWYVVRPSGEKLDAD